MKVSKLIQEIRHYPDADVKISTESFVRVPIEGIATNKDEVTLCAYDLLEIISSMGEARTEDDDI